MKFKFIKSVNDKRGTIFFYSLGKLIVHFVETKAGFSRGGHYHPFQSDHVLLQGKVKFQTMDLKTNIKQSKIISAPFVISVEPNIPHLLTALNDSLFLECFNIKYSAVDYPPFREIVDEKM